MNKYFLLMLMFSALLLPVLSLAKQFEYKTDYAKKVIHISEEQNNCEIQVVDTDLETQNVVSNTADIGKLQMFLQYEDGSHFYEIKTNCEDDDSYCRDIKTTKKDLKTAEFFMWCENIFPACISEVNENGFDVGLLDFNVLDYGNKKQKKILIKAFNLIAKKISSCAVQPEEYHNSYELEKIGVKKKMQALLQDEKATFEFVNRYAVGNFKSDSICAKTISGVRLLLSDRKYGEWYYDGAKGRDALSDELWDEKCEGLITREEKTINTMKSYISKANSNYELKRYELRGHSDLLNAVCGEVTDTSSQTDIRYYYDFLNGVYFENSDEYFLEQWNDFCLN